MFVYVFMDMCTYQNQADTIQYYERYKYKISISYVLIFDIKLYLCTDLDLDMNFQMRKSCKNYLKLA